MDWKIPQEVFDTYKAAVDAMITDNWRRMHFNHSRTS